MNTSWKKFVLVAALIAPMGGCNTSDVSPESNEYKITNLTSTTQDTKHVVWRLRELDKKLSRVEYKVDMLLPRKLGRGMEPPAGEEK